MSEERGLGRFRHQDPRDLNHLARDHLRGVTGAIDETPEYEIGDILHQGFEGVCVGAGCTAWENSKPVGHARQQDIEFARKWYDDATLIDPFPQNDLDRTFGTTVRAGLRVALMRGYATEFVRIATVAEFDAWMGAGKGGVIVGSAWLRSMDDESSGGFIPVDLASGERGGHCYFFYKKDSQQRRWIQQSWGHGYGLDGTGYFSDQGFRKLFTFDMEAYGMVQTGVPPRR
jgi:hypothetical protein